MWQKLNKRANTKLFLISVLLIVLGPILISVLNQRLDEHFQTDLVSLPPEQSAPTQTTCIPEIEPAAYAVLDQLVVTQNDGMAVSLKMANLIFADQAARQFPGNTDPQKFREDDTLRRIEVLGYIQNGEIHSGHDLIYAAFIFQHGDCSDHYQFANRLAQIAMDEGYSDAKWIYAATMDRYLMSRGELQKYGTQYTWIEGAFKLYPVNPATTDTERAQYNVPPLSEAMNKKVDDEGGGTVQKKWLETWWLTLIGAGFAVLAAVIGLMESVPDTHGWGVLGLAILVYLVSVIGHYAQIIALKQGLFEIQRNFWLVVNGLVLVVWFVLASFEGIGFHRKTRRNPV